MSEELIQCSNCHRLPQPRSEFVNGRNKLCKLCRKCREKANKKNSKPESKEYRENWKKTQDPERMRRQQLEGVRAYTRREKEKDEKAYNEHIQAVRKLNVNAKVSGMKRNAEIRNISWELSDEDAIRMIRSACTYCGYLELTKTMNGIDRLDFNGIYILDNCVPCCAHCNMMKGCYDPQSFLRRCRAIANCSHEFPEVAVNDQYKTMKKRV